MVQHVNHEVVLCGHIAWSLISCQILNDWPRMLIVLNVRDNQELTL